MILRTTTLASIFAMTALFCGCEEPASTGGPAVMSDDHDGHDHGGAGHPENLGEALHQLTDMRNTIRDAFAGDDAEGAHGPLHEVGHLVKDVSELAGKAELSDEAKATITSNTKTLMDAFGAVDKKMHSEDEGSDYSEVSEKIDAALAAIVTAAGPAGEYHDHGEGHDDHDGHDHDENHKDDHDHDEGHKDGHDHKDGDKKE